MLDDIRNHQPQPNAEELRWMAIDPLAATLRVATLAVVALAIGGFAGAWLGEAPASATVAKAGRG